MSRWINPRYRELTGHEPPGPSTPPAEQGERLATFARGESQELRVTLSEYRSRPYVAIRLWERNEAGDWWPTRKGSSIRLAEIEDLAEALGRALELADQGGPRERPGAAGPREEGSHQRGRRERPGERRASDEGPVSGGVRHYPGARPTDTTPPWVKAGGLPLDQGGGGEFSEF